MNIAVEIEKTTNMDNESYKVAIEEIIFRIQNTNTEEITPEQALAILKSYKSLL